MRYILYIDIKPFKGKYRRYSGLYTPLGKKSKKAKIEVDSNDTISEQLDSLAHELTHFMANVYNPNMGEKREEEIAQMVGKYVRKKI